ncbi:MAG: hypothetical protein LBJ57_05060, partial [Prevotellaceae bacterium]|nr:hypothetical protein [Prevotellaceae bacterium]
FYYVYSSHNFIDYYLALQRYIFFVYYGRRKEMNCFLIGKQNFAFSFTHSALFVVILLRIILYFSKYIRSFALSNIF